jgi:phage baseplate assembly protein W
MKGIAVTSETIEILSDVELASHRLERLISIAVGEIPGIPRAGSRLKELFWEPLDAETSLQAIEEVKTLIKLYEPNILVTSISVYIQTLNSDSQGMIIEINAQLANNKKSFDAKIIKVRDA